MGIQREIRWQVAIAREGSMSKTDSNTIFDYMYNVRARGERGLECPNHYGMSYILRRYSRFRPAVNAHYEHFPATYTLRNKWEYTDRNYPSLFVNSKLRADLIKSFSDRLIFDIGPSIAYGKCIYSDFEIDAIKKSLGRVLCVYPIHSLSETRWEVDTMAFIDYIESIQKYYDTVIVSMYFADIVKGEHIKYEKKGWTIVSSGYRDNRDFNDLMKTIISISDQAVFQNYSSAVGYCVYMNVPVQIYKQDSIYKADINAQGELIKEEAVEKKLEEEYALFSDLSHEISPEQYNYCNEKYGYASIKNPEEMWEILEFSRKARNIGSRRALLKESKKEKYKLAQKYIEEAIDRKFYEK